MSQWAQRAAARALASGMAATVTMRWQTTTGGQLDPTTGAVEGGTVTPQTVSLKALVHEVNPARGEFQRFAEIETGDVVLDMAPDVVLDGKEALEFDIGGRTYVPANRGSEASRHYDALLAGGATFRTLLLKRKP